MKKPFYLQLGNLLKEARQQRKLSQEDAADRIGVTRQTISNYENAVSEISMEDLIKLCDIYNVDVNDLIAPVRKFAYKK